MRASYVLEDFSSKIIVKPILVLKGIALDSQENMIFRNNLVSEVPD